MTSDDIAPAKRIWDRSPAGEYRRVIVLDKPRDDGTLAMHFDETANRVADTFAGAPIDDTTLIPWLYLRRHAIELELKNLIRVTARLRRKGGESGAELELEVINRKLRSPKVGHHLDVLAALLNKNLVAMGLEELDSPTTEHIRELSAEDGSGMSFRYTSELPALPKSGDSEQVPRMDFPAFRKHFEDRYNGLCGVLDVLDLYEDSLGI